MRKVPKYRAEKRLAVQAVSMLSATKIMKGETGMQGYVKIEKPEMKVKDFEIYSGYYCGVCKSIGANYGQIPRLSLSYDAAFLATLIDGIDQDKYNITREHCIIHPIKKKTIIRSDAVDYAADVMLLLGYHKLEDDILDEKKVEARIAAAVLKGTYKKISKSYYELDKFIKEQLDILHCLEEAKCDSIDKAAEPFARILEKIFTYYFRKGKNKDENSKRVIGRLGYILGKWMYLIDAVDDIEEDVTQGNYNPLIYKIGIKKSDWQKKRKEYLLAVKEIGGQNLMIYGSEMTKIADLLKLEKNQSIIENIITMGLLRSIERTLDEILEADFEEVGEEKKWTRTKF